ncbi:glutamate 5-kinase [uncultured Propionibacterium sp.]|uniref:glutamate 5-kinase n=1 Tax=uncultured Propionibacterium sp. TaxID=218066 RepID=UPI00292D6AE4|nr:glutamate 5-kinase [uncultured Propionibacterium sp.]
MTEQDTRDACAAGEEAALRGIIAGAHRVVVKVGSSSISSAANGMDTMRLAGLVKALADAHDAGRDVVLVSSGAIAAGMSPLGLAGRPRDLAHQQAAAAVGQGLLMERYAELFAARGLLAGQLLLTADDMTRQSSYRNASRTLGTLLRMGAVPIVNENDTVATHEISLGDNDRLAALVAQVVRANALILLSDVSGLYTGHPDEPDSERIDFVGDIDELTVDTRRAGTAGVGTGGMTTKVQAAQIATGSGIPVLLTGASRAEQALAGVTGTVFAPVDHMRPRRLMWLAYASQSRGRLMLDAGAVRALTMRKASLLAAGITGVSGRFLAGDPVELVGPDGAVVARGLVNFSSEELPGMLGRNSAELASELGVGYEREVVHRDMLVLMHRGD